MNHRLTPTCLLVFEATISKVLTFQISLSSITVLLSFRTSVDVHQASHEVGLGLEGEWLIAINLF